MNNTIVLSELLQLPFRTSSTHNRFIDTRLHAMIAAVGHERRTHPPYAFHGLKRGNAEFAVLQYTLGGEGRLDFEGQPYTLNPGQAMLLTMPHNHEYALLKGKTWQFFFVTVYGSAIVPHWRHAISRLGPVLDLPFDTPFIQTAADICSRYIQGEHVSAPQTSAAAYTLTMHLLDLWPSSQHRNPASRSKNIQRAVAYCREHLSQDIGVEDMATAAGYSRHHFTRLFTQSEGCPPGEFLSRERIRLAIRLLQTTDTPIAIVAEQCGYKEPSYFCRVFRKMVGMSPRDLRYSNMTG